MITRPIIGSKYRSTLTGRYVRVKNVVGDRVLVNMSGNDEHIHVRDFNAEYRLIPMKGVHHGNTGASRTVPRNAW